MAHRQPKAMKEGLEEISRKQLDKEVAGTIGLMEDTPSPVQKEAPERVIAVKDGKVYRSMMKDEREQDLSKDWFTYSEKDTLIMCEVKELSEIPELEHLRAQNPLDIDGVMDLIGDARWLDDNMTSYFTPIGLSQIRSILARHFTQSAKVDVEGVKLANSILEFLSGLHWKTGHCFSFLTEENPVGLVEKDRLQRQKTEGRAKAVSMLKDYLTTALTNKPSGEGET